MFSLLDSASVSGTSQTELEEALVDLVRHTGFTQAILPKEMNLYALELISGQIIYAKSVRPSDVKIVLETNNRYVQSVNPLQKITSIFSEEPDLFKESVAHGVFLSCNQWPDPVPVSAHAVDDMLSMVSLNGKGTAGHGFPVLSLLSSNLENKQISYVITDASFSAGGGTNGFNYRTDQIEKNLTDSRGILRKFNLRFMYRWDDAGNVKIFSAISSRYGEIPQTRVLEVIDRLLVFGKPEVRDWTINHFQTQVNVIFPEIAEDYAETYGLSKAVMPGIRIVTSDSKDASFYVEGTISIGSSDSLPMEADQARISKRHFGGGDIDSVLQRVNLDIFPLYRQYPEKLCELLATQEEIPVKKCLEAAFRAMGLRNRSMEISAKTETEIINALISQACVDRMPVYDAVYMALTAHKNLSLSLSENQRSHLRAHALRAVLITEEYRQIIEEEKTCQNSTATTASASLQAAS